MATKADQVCGIGLTRMEKSKNGRSPAYVVNNNYYRRANFSDHKFYKPKQKSTL